MLSKKTVEKIANQNILISDLSDDELAEFCIIANQMYRDGESIVSDQDYDFVFLAELAKRLPDHPFLQKLESEKITVKFSKNQRISGQEWDFGFGNSEIDFLKIIFEKII